MQQEVLATDSVAGEQKMLSDLSAGPLPELPGVGLRQGQHVGRVQVPQGPALLA